MSWQDEVDETARRRALARQLGGEEAIAKQHERGRLTVRERIEGLCDVDSFYEQGPLAGYAELDDDGTLKDFTPANYVLGLARVAGRPIAVGGEDFTQKGGSPSPAGLRKSVYAEELAIRQRVPLVRFLEGGGGSVRGTGGGKGAPRPSGEPVFSGHRFTPISQVLDLVPVASAALGAVAGFPAARLAASHLAVMTKHTAQVLIGGPALVERALGEVKTKEELGGAKVHARSGVVDIVAEDEADAFDIIRRFLSYLPTNVLERPPRGESTDPRERCEESLLEIVPRDRRKIYNMRKLVGAVVDEGSWLEMTAGYGRSQITGLARLDGTPVGVLANDPRFYGGSMGAEGAQKLRRFVELCDTFHLPVLSFVDEPGFMIGSASEAAATIRYGVDAIRATVRASVPWAAITVRKSYGVAAAAHYGDGGSVFSWPSAERGALPIEGGVAVAFRREIAAAPDPEAHRSKLEEQLAGRRSPFPAAEAFGVNDLIDPRRTRPVLCDWLDWHQRQLDEHVRVRAARLQAGFL